MNIDDFVSIQYEDDILCISSYETDVEYPFELIGDDTYVDLTEADEVHLTKEEAIHRILDKTEFRIYYDAYYLTKPEFDGIYRMAADAYYTYRSQLQYIPRSLITQHKFFNRKT